MSLLKNANPVVCVGREEGVAPDALVTCHACLREVSWSVAATAEGSDYLLYFCGPDCFAQWRKRSAHEQSPAVPA